MSASFVCKQIKGFAETTLCAVIFAGVHPTAMRELIGRHCQFDPGDNRAARRSPRFFRSLFTLGEDFHVSILTYFKAGIPTTTIISLPGRRKVPVPRGPIPTLDSLYGLQAE